jgi:hypothetical protein
MLDARYAQLQWAFEQRESRVCVCVCVISREISRASAPTLHLGAASLIVYSKPPNTPASYCRLRNVGLVCVFYKSKSSLVCDLDLDGENKTQAAIRMVMAIAMCGLILGSGHIKRAMHGSDCASDWPSFRQVARLHCSAAGWALHCRVSVGDPVAQYTLHHPKADQDSHSQHFCDRILINDATN